MHQFCQAYDALAKASTCPISSAFLSQPNKCNSPYYLTVSLSLSLSLFYFYFYFSEISIELTYEDTSSGLGSPQKLMAGGVCQGRSMTQLSCPYTLPHVSTLGCCQKQNTGLNRSWLCPQMTIFKNCSATKLAVFLIRCAYLCAIYYLKVNICTIVFRKVWTTSMTFSSVSQNVVLTLTPVS